MTPYFKEQLGCEGSMSQHDTLTRALQEIADWNSHTTEFAVDYGSNGVRDFYRNIARAALSATQPAQAAQSVPGVNKAVQLIPGMTKEQFAYVHHCALEVDAAKAETARLLAENAALKAQAAQSEPAEHWHRLYLEKCQQYNDRVAQLGGVIEGLEAEAAQGAGEVVGVYGGTSNYGDIIVLYEDLKVGTKLYTQPAAGADVLDAGRYRWLRTALADRSNQGKSHWFCSIPEGAPSELDSAIDAAIAASGRQE